MKEDFFNRPSAPVKIIKRNADTFGLGTHDNVINDDSKTVVNFTMQTIPDKFYFVAHNLLLS